jgi:prephenate dehydratase
LGNYNLLKESKVKIIGELSLHITQNLMALPGTTIETIREIYSHPIAIQQSMEFLSNYPHIKLIEWSDTASSAQKIATNNYTIQEQLQVNMLQNYTDYKFWQVK